MKSPDFQLTRLDKEVACVTLTTMRKIRGAITTNPCESVDVKFDEVRRLATSCATFLLETSGGKRQPSKSRETISLIELLEEKYSPLGPVYTTSDGRYTVDVLEEVLGAMKVDLAGTIRDDLFNQNGLSGLDQAKLESSRFGVFAPLSGDYLYATLFREAMLRNGSKNPFLLTPVAVSADLRQVILPDLGIKRDFTEVAVITDARGSGSTRKAVTTVLNGLYPGRIISS